MTATAWPWPGDSPLRIARKIANVYREHLRLNSRPLCDAVDDTMVAYGQLWIVPQVEHLDPTADVTTAEAAVLASVNPPTIHQWACTPHPRPEHQGHMLLPRFGWRPSPQGGRERTYLAVHVLAAAEIARTERLRRHVA
jgi:hypothetical protein